MGIEYEVFVIILYQMESKFNICLYVYLFFYNKFIFCIKFLVTIPKLKMHFLYLET